MRVLRSAAWEGRGVGGNVGFEQPLHGQHVRAQALVRVVIAVATQSTATELDGVVAIVATHHRLETFELNALRLFGVAVGLVDHAVQRRLHALMIALLSRIPRGPPREPRGTGESGSRELVAARVQGMDELVVRVGEELDALLLQLQCHRLHVDPNLGEMLHCLTRMLE